MAVQQNNEENVWGLLNSAFSNEVSLGLNLETVVDVFAVDDDAPLDDSRMIDIFYTKKDFISIAGLFEEPEGENALPRLTIRRSVALQAKEYLVEYSSKTEGWY